MQDSILGPWRDVAIVLLVIEIFVILLIPGAIFYFAIRGVRAVKRFIRPPLLTARVWALRVQHESLRASQVATALPIAIEATDARLRATARGIAEIIGLDSERL